MQRDPPMLGVAVRMPMINGDGYHQPTAAGVNSRFPPVDADAEPIVSTAPEPTLHFRPPASAQITALLVAVLVGAVP